MTAITDRHHDSYDEEREPATHEGASNDCQGFRRFSLPLGIGRFFFPHFDWRLLTDLQVVGRGVDFDRYFLWTSIGAAHIGDSCSGCGGGCL